MKNENIVNQRFGKLLVLEKDITKRTLYKCICDCGKIKFARIRELKRGKLKSCGCLKTSPKLTLRKDLTGIKKFKLKAIKNVGLASNGDVLWECLCDCGNIKNVSISHLWKDTKSCGCLNKQNKIIHNFSKHKLYDVWRQMRARCNNKNHSAYKYYGGRGIKVCDRWNSIEKNNHGFLNFLNDMGECPVGFSIDRIDNDKNYEPNNCRWATKKEQANNKRHGNMCRKSL